MKLEYQTEHPLDRVISQQCMSKYNTLFFFLLKLKRTIYCLTLLWKELNGAEFRVSTYRSLLTFLVHYAVENFT